MAGMATAAELLWLVEVDNDMALGMSPVITPIPTIENNVTAAAATITNGFVLPIRGGRVALVRSQGESAAGRSDIGVS
jgi:hypothetical protein